MSSKRALVLEKDGQDYILLTTEGEFIRRRLAQEAAVGEEIELPELSLIDNPELAAATPCGPIELKQLPAADKAELAAPSLEQTHDGGIGNKTGLRATNRFRQSRLRSRGWANIAAVLVFALILTLNWNLFVHPQAVAAISLDINPRLELTVDSNKSVLEANPINQEAQELLNALKLRGKPLQTALSEIIQEAARLNFITPGQDWIVVGISALVEEKQQNAAIPTTKEIEAIIHQEVQNAGMPGKVATFQVSPEQRAKAQTEGLTTAEYGLYEAAKQAGLEVKPDEVRDAAERLKLLENEAVQAKIQSQAEQLLQMIQSFNSYQAKGMGLRSGSAKDKRSENRYENKSRKENKQAARGNGKFDLNLMNNWLFGSGYFNSGYFNSGYFNSGYFSSGYFSSGHYGSFTDKYREFQENGNYSKNDKKDADKLKNNSGSKTKDNGNNKSNNNKSNDIKNKNNSDNKNNNSKNNNSKTDNSKNNKKNDNKFKSNRYNNYNNSKLMEQIQGKLKDKLKEFTPYNYKSK